MLSRNQYIGVTVMLFIIAYVPSLINTILFSVLETQTIDFSFLPRFPYKILIVFLICIMESSLIKKEFPGIIGWVLTLFLFFGYTFRIMHWPFSKEIMAICIALILINLIIYAIIDMYGPYEKIKTIGS